MSLRAGHGNGKGQPRIEVLPPDELPQPVAAPRAAATGPVHRRQNGTIADSAAAKVLGQRGGRAKARNLRLVDSLGLARLADDAHFAPYRVAADDFVKAHLASLASQAGGDVGTGPSTMVASAALQLAASRFCFDLGAEASDPSMMKMGSALANDSRQNLMAAYEMAVREGAARKTKPNELPMNLEWVDDEPGTVAP